MPVGGSAIRRYRRPRHGRPCTGVLAKRSLDLGSSCAAQPNAMASAAPWQGVSGPTTAARAACMDGNVQLRRSLWASVTVSRPPDRRTDQLADRAPLAGEDKICSHISPLPISRSSTIQSGSKATNSAAAKLSARLVPRRWRVGKPMRAVGTAADPDRIFPQIDLQPPQSNRTCSFSGWPCWASDPGGIVSQTDPNGVTLPPGCCAAGQAGLPAVAPWMASLASWTRLTGGRELHPPAGAGPSQPLAIFL